MKKVLFLTNTHFQLLTAIQICRVKYSGDLVDIVITNHSDNCENVAQRLKESGFCNNVFYICERDAKSQLSSSYKLKKSIPSFVFRNKIFGQDISYLKGYDDIWFYNPILLTQLVISNNPKADVYRFEEGFGTYTKPFFESRFVDRIYSLVFGNIESRVKALYVFHPELYRLNHDYSIESIPPFSRNDAQLRSLFNLIYDFDPALIPDGIRNIFFEEAFINNGIDIGDLDVIDKLSETLPDILYIKKHPRSPRSFECQRNIVVLDSLNKVPWEVVMMNLKCDNCNFFTISSASVLAPALYFGDSVSSYFLFNCTDKTSPNVNDVFMTYIDDLKKDHPEIQVLSEISEIKKSL